MERGVSPIAASKDVALVDERAKHLLKTLVERYIVEGQPVGSRQLARDAGLQLSAATVRNVMADLEEIGLVASPHTSAGRVPTSRGFRFFVDMLLQVRPLTEESTQRLLRQLGAGPVAPDLVAQAASQLLSNMTHMAGFVRVPKISQSAFRQIDFVALNDRRVLVVLVTQSGQVENRIIQTERPMPPNELARAANYFNELFAGLPLSTVAQRLQEELSQTRSQMDQILRSAMEMGREVLHLRDEEVVIDGEFNLLDSSDLANLQQLRELLEVFRQKRDLVHLLDECTRADGIRIFIGEESGYAPLSQCSMITAPYQVDGQILGVLGVIGPTRMPYQDIIPLVDCTAQILSGVLSLR
ncbi:MAG: heat-inducible transcriptional repressor HrcA [Pseudomonadota bacterium]